jgi:adenylate cyclase
MHTSAPLPSLEAIRAPGRALRALRLGSGLVLAVYVTAHLCNHALGVFSIDTQEALLDVLRPIWQSAPGTTVLYTALILHPLLGLYALWRRQTLRMPAWERAQLALGLAVPLLLIPHVFGTRVSASIAGTETTYHAVVAGIFANPAAMIRQPVLVTIVWAHLCVGLHYWLRLRDGYRRSLRFIYPLAVMLPVLALFGFWGAGIELGEAAASGRAPPARKAPNPQAVALLEARQQQVGGTYVALLAIVLLGRGVRRRRSARGGAYRVHHADGRVITAPVGHTLLEALREAGIAHASVCGGRARCTTCRVRVDRGLRELPPPQPLELAALQRIHADSDVRLACQLRPVRNIRITPLMPPHVGASDAGSARMPGRERRGAVMFVDLRESSRLGEQRMPYDVFFILNRFFAELAEALRETGGYYSTFNGDGLMALYGTTTDVRRGCRDAMRGAIAIAERLAKMNAAMAADLGEPLQAGISIHAGEAIVGTMGPPATPLLSALGDTVNVAARLEEETKQHRCVLVVSAACAEAGEVDLSAFPRHTSTVRGRSEPVTYYAIREPHLLAPALAQ